ncbi:hypothetical protein K438DRAFT_1987438 [Mycena galopus ATCC 62051]|nr:hypothetical protein K438DRAFT_1987438 [Mycena galopus ATCC 62051]
MALLRMLCIFYQSSCGFLAFSRGTQSLSIVNVVQDSFETDIMKILLATGSALWQARITSFLQIAIYVHHVDEMTQDVARVIRELILGSLANCPNLSKRLFQHVSALVAVLI